MIRPLTVATCLLACASGLYLYQEKHEVQLLDRKIERTVHDTNTLREQSRLLAAEWTMLNDPERLREFSDTYLSLKTITPAQFSSLADLDSRLPARQVEVPPHDEPPLVQPVSQAEPTGTPDPAPDPGAPNAEPAPVAEEELPVPPIPRAPPAAVAAAPLVRPIDIRPPERLATARPATGDIQSRALALAQPRLMDQRAADQRPAEQRLPEQRAAEQRPPEQRALDQRAAEQRPWDPPLQDQRPAEQRAAPRVADTRNDIRPAVAPPPRPIMLAARRPPLQASAPLPASGPVAAAPIFTPSRPPPVAAPSPYGGSLLGMARGSMPASPRPTPVSAQYNAN